MLSKTTQKRRQMCGKCCSAVSVVQHANHYSCYDPQDPESAQHYSRHQEQASISAGVTWLPTQTFPFHEIRQYQKSQTYGSSTVFYKQSEKLLKPCSLTCTSRVGPLGLYRKPPKPTWLACLKTPSSIPEGIGLVRSYSCSGASMGQAPGLWAHDKRFILLWGYRCWILLFPRMLLKQIMQMKKLRTETLALIIFGYKAFMQGIRFSN